MEDNKLVNFFLECQYFRLGLLLMPLQIHSILLRNFAHLESKCYWLTLSNAIYSVFIVCIMMKVDVAKIQTLN